MPKLTNKSTFDTFIDDEYQSKKFIKNTERERVQNPVITYDDVAPLLNQIFKI
jgi:hypothetical protein|tara:strand:+ start:132 stop:290 length:159 start_codon:yes stop_codon:yes gene_type:complete